MTKIKRLVAVLLALMMIFGSVSIVASAWDATVDDGFALDVTTKISGKLTANGSKQPKSKQAKR